MAVIVVLACRAGAAASRRRLSRHGNWTRPSRRDGLQSAAMARTPVGAPRGGDWSPPTRPIPPITYAVVWKQRPNILSKLPNLKAIFSIGAGVDHLFADQGVPDVPIVRVVAENLTPVHDGICRLARSRPPPPGHALPRPAEEEDLARAGPAAGRRRQRSASWASASSASAAGKALRTLGYRVQRLEPHREQTVPGVRDLPRRCRAAALPQCHRHSGRAAAADAGRRTASSITGC